MFLLVIQDFFSVNIFIYLFELKSEAESRGNVKWIVHYVQSDFRAKVEIREINVASSAYKWHLLQYKWYHTKNEEQEKRKGLSLGTWISRIPREGGRITTRETNQLVKGKKEKWGVYGL